MFQEQVTEEIRQSVRAEIAADPNAILDRVAEKIGVPEAVAAAALEEEMCRILPAGDFERIWEIMTQWEKITFIAVTPGMIVEVKGRLPKGSFGHGFFNLAEKENPLGGHVMIKDLGMIALVSKPFMGLESHSVRFYNQKGEAMFAVYVGREDRKLIPSVRDGFMALRQSASA